MKKKKEIKQGRIYARIFTCPTFRNSICEALRDLVPFIQFEPATLLKVTLLELGRCFSRFLNCTSGTKSRNASHIENRRYIDLGSVFCILY